MCQSAPPGPSCRARGCADEGKDDDKERSFQRGTLPAKPWNMHLRSLVTLVASTFAVLLAACGGKIEEPPCVGSCEPEETPKGGSPEISIPASSGQPAGATDEAPPLACPGPYMLETEDHRCVWSCSEGTEPARGGLTECVCSSGLSQIGTDSFGRRVCR